jgi:hypothetical protein
VLFADLRGGGRRFVTAFYFEIASQATQTKKATVMTTNTNAANPSMKVIPIPQLERQHGPKDIEGQFRQQH